MMKFINDVRMGDLGLQMREAEALDLEIKVQLAKVGFEL
jgi:hypothetical protein